ncbi:FtsX-like permease family protein (plasmid) [Entomospira entomophila]|uniref:ABC transporter permease n=1 Tax=Entomospira entomophila TaxID=2719988 RepID=A0A968KX30_9SPIO|nr:FtsX-like permease family protein [Entomospira entomophilus]NIZ41430.1 ABC transporter permease [Entomospira entomophilus]WDI36380.1 FtsX-like permease family protein [Entomospira entomophilus]
MLFITIALRNIFRSKSRSLFAFFSVAVVAFILTMVTSVAEGLVGESIANSRLFISGDIQVEHQDYERYFRFNPLGYLVSEEPIAELFAQKYPDLEVSARDQQPSFLYQNETLYPLMIFSYSPNDTPWIEAIQILEGHFPSSSKEIAMGYDLANTYQLKVGDRVMLLTQTADGGSNAVSYTLSAIVNFPSASYNANGLIMQNSDLAYLLRTQGHTHLQITSRTALSQKELASLAKELESQLPAEYLLRSWHDTDAGSLLRIQHFMIGLMTSIFFILGSGVIINTAIMSLLERTTEIGLLRAFGFSTRQVRSLFLLESVILHTVAIISGILLAVILSWLLNLFPIHLDTEATKAYSSYNISGVIRFAVKWDNLWRIALIAFTISTIVSYIPTRMITRLRISTILRTQV